MAKTWQNPRFGMNRELYGLYLIETGGSPRTVAAWAWCHFASGPVDDSILVLGDKEEI